jgi:hypothetical protein
MPNSFSLPRRAVVQLEVLQSCRLVALEGSAVVLCVPVAHSAAVGLAVVHLLLLDAQRFIRYVHTGHESLGKKSAFSKKMNDRCDSASDGTSTPHAPSDPSNRPLPSSIISHVPLPSPLLS